MNDWFGRIHSGQIQLPRFQRFEAWGAREVAELLQTVVDELPAGAALVLDIGDKAPFPHRPLAGAPAPSERMTELLLDGQQRLTAIWRALRDDYDNRTYFVDIRDVDDDGDGRRDYKVKAQSRWWRNGARYPQWCDDPVQVFERGLIPASLLNPLDQTAYVNWLKAAVKGDTDQMVEIQPLILSLRGRFATFNLPFLALPVGSSEATVLSVFVRLNTGSVPLSAFDIIVARVEGETGESLHDLVDSLAGQVPGLSRYVSPADLVLPAAALLQGKRPSQRELVFLDFERMVEDWPKIVRGAERLVTFLEQESVFDAQRLPNVTALQALLVLWANVSEKPDLHGAARTLLRRYFWLSAVTSRYEFAAATALFQDFQPLLEAIENQTFAADAPIFDEALPEPGELLLANWPKRRDRLSRAMLGISLRRDALDIADGAPVTAENITQREYHHLYPVAFLAENGIPEAAASVALNCALLTWRTNRTISALPPVDYLRDRSDGAALGEQEIRTRLASHLIDYDSLSAGNFEEFLAGRAEQMHEAIASLCRGEDWGRAVT
jgi:hypothetical protein